MVFHLGIICFLCFSCLSVSRVPQYFYLMTDFNAPHRTVLADFQHTALQSISLLRQRLVQIMHDSRARQWVVGQVVIELFPCK